MDLNPKPRLEFYWDTRGRASPSPIISTAIGKNLWKQINRYLQVYQPPIGPVSLEIASLPPSPWISPNQKVEWLASKLRDSFVKYWRPNTHLAVDECIQAFCGRSADIVTIPTKPTPTGFKIWCIADGGYVLGFAFHRRGIKKDQGPQGLNSLWKTVGFSSTQGVVLQLIFQLEDRGVDHVIWMDNLFTTHHLLAYLREHHIAAAGTVRIGRTAREKAEAKEKGEAEDSEDTEENEEDKEAPPATASSSALLSSQPEMTSAMAPPTTAPPATAPTELSQISLASQTSSQLLLGSQESIDLIKRAIPRKIPPKKPAEKLATKLATKPSKSLKKTPSALPAPPATALPATILKKRLLLANGLHPLLVELKKHYTKLLNWGEYFASVKDKVLQFGWKDNAVVLFMTTFHDAPTTTIKPRKKPKMVLYSLFLYYYHRYCYNSYRR
jgi:hypothetical protein